MAEFLDSLPAAPALHTFVYLLAFCNRHEAASDVISSVALEWVGMDVPLKFGDSMQTFLRYMNRSLCDE